MAAPPPERDHPSGLPRRRQQAPSLDVMAAQSSPAPAAPPADDSEASTAAAAQDSRSSSSSNSPLPNDNEESDFFLGPNDSESSLGVTNLQDMQVSGGAEEDACVPPINRLPNELLIAIFDKVGSLGNLMNCMLTCKRWARNSVDLLWVRPACTSWPRHKAICQTLSLPHQSFQYKDFVRRLNLASIADKVSDGSVLPLAGCNRIERLTLTNCKHLSDAGLIPLVFDSRNLLALDISYAEQITEWTTDALAKHCRRLQGLNISGCTKISNEGLIRLAESCRYIKRIKLNDCSQLSDEAVTAFAKNCPNILEIDLHQCSLITNQPITDLLTQGQALRELRLANCELISDEAFLALPSDRVFEHLRILDLTSCARLTDNAVDKIIAVAPRLRNLVLAKCRNITDLAVHSISRLGKNLHYLHLGHCSHITDEAVKKLVSSCNRIRYIDLGCCVHLTDDSVVRLATLPKLKRIGLVKCSNITDESVHALARANQRQRQRRDVHGNVIDAQYYGLGGSLERVHLSYCTNLTIRGIIRLLNACRRLTHLSLTGVPAFLREDLGRFCRSPPPEFTLHQREVFCVFSGDGVSELRDHFNNQPGYAAFRERPAQPAPALLHAADLATAEAPGGGHSPIGINGDGQMLSFDDADAELPSDDDLGDVSVNDNMMAEPHAPHDNGHDDIIPPPPPLPPSPPLGLAGQLNGAHISAAPYFTNGPPPRTVHQAGPSTAPIRLWSPAANTPAAVVFPSTASTATLTGPREPLQADEHGPSASTTENGTGLAGAQDN